MNKLKVTPTSRLIFSGVYPGYTAHTFEQNKEAIDDRLLKRYNLNKKQSLKIIKRDRNIIESRGEVLVDYAFAQGFSLPTTLDILYSQLSMSDDVDEMFQKLTFSELALARDLFSELEKIYNKRVDDADISIFREKEERLASYFGFLEYFSQIALGLRLGKINFQDFSIYSLDSISDISHFERFLIASNDSYLQRDVDLRKRGQLGTSDVEVQTIRKRGRR